MKNSTAASRYYKVDFLNNTVSVSASFLKKASVLGSPEYQKMRQLREELAGFEFKQMDAPKSKAANKNKNLTYVKMIEHIKTVEGEHAEAVLKEMDKVKALAEIQNNPYQYVRDWFLKKYPDVRPAADAQETKSEETAAKAS